MILSRWVMQQRKASSQNTQTTSSNHFLTECFSSLSIFVTWSHTNTLRGESSCCQLLDTLFTDGNGTLYFHGDTEPNNMFSVFLCIWATEKERADIHATTLTTHKHLCPHTHMHTQNNTRRDTFLIASNSQHVQASLVSCCLRGVWGTA